MLVVPPGWISHLELQWHDLGMREMYERLAARYELVFYDKRGMGLSEREREDFSLADELADLEAVVDEVTRGPIALFGSSQGGPLSIAYAAAHPERVNQLVLFGAYESGARIAKPAVRDSLIALVRASWGLGAEAMASVFVPAEIDATFHARLMHFQREAASGAVAARLLEAIYSWDVSAVSPHVRAPTLVIHRRNDHAIPSRLGIELAARIPDARLALLDGGIHCPWLGDWESVVHLVESFVPAGPAPAPPISVPPRRPRYETLRYEVEDAEAAREPSRFRVGLAQIGEPDDVFTRGPSGLFRLPAARVASVARVLERVVGDAAEHGVRLLAFPEMTLDLNIAELEAQLAEYARRHEMYIVAGGYHDEGTRANVCKVLGPRGLVWQQRKHIPAVLTLAGEAIHEPIDAPAPYITVVAATPFGRIAIATCRDFLDLDLLVELRNAEPPIDVLINPAFTPVTADFSAAHLGARRALYTSTVFCNHATFGDSEIFSPEKRKRRVHVAPRKVTVVHRDIPLFELRAERRAWEQRAHHRFIQSTRSA
ncbi:MAG: alpha/beta fold hydrolase [Deltaproteobacteria bacterium]|nr:alpha/beta fold hydrolase [Deltaproteobacteria bacterium]